MSKLSNVESDRNTSCTLSIGIRYWSSEHSCEWVSFHSSNLIGHRRSPDSHRCETALLTLFCEAGSLTYGDGYGCHTLCSLLFGPEAAVVCPRLGFIMFYFEMPYRPYELRIEYFQGKTVVPSCSWVIVGSCRFWTNVSPVCNGGYYFVINFWV